MAKPPGPKEAQNRELQKMRVARAKELIDRTAGSGKLGKKIIRLKAKAIGRMTTIKAKGGTRGR